MHKVLVRHFLDAVVLTPLTVPTEEWLGTLPRCSAWCLRATGDLEMDSEVWGRFRDDYPLVTFVHIGGAL
jgi:hypothetical protein